MGYEDRMDARSDFLAENCPDCDDCLHYEITEEDIDNINFIQMQHAAYRELTVSALIKLLIKRGASAVL